MLSISVVTYNSDLLVLEKLIASLIVAIEKLPSEFVVDKLTFIDNSPDSSPLQHKIANYAGKLPETAVTCPGKNLGYGKAHNLAIRASESTFHLILNPDVILAPECLNAGLSWLLSHPGTVAISPLARNLAGEELYLTKNRPGILTLFLRSLKLNVLNEFFSASLSCYENRQLQSKREIVPVELISGCFMLCRTDALRKIGGFDEGYFLYFEDFALSRNLNEIGEVQFHPGMQITHAGGDASRKGLRHIYLFIKSGIRFFNQYGWKLV